MLVVENHPHSLYFARLATSAGDEARFCVGATHRGHRVTFERFTGCDRESHVFLPTTMSQAVRITTPSEAKRPFYLGVDVGGTGIKLGLVDDIGQTLAFETLPTNEPQGPAAAMEHVAKALHRMVSTLGIELDEIAAIGLGAPGPMDIDAGLLVQPPQLPTWWNFNLRDALAELTQRPVTLNNDANAAAYGEYWLGCGRSAKSMVLLTLGTGVGGGIISEGQLINGANSFGGEFGHLVVDPAPDARLCGWGGGRGQLEAYASASAVAIYTRQRLNSGATSCLASIPGDVTPLDVYHAATQNDPLALEIIDDAARWLGVGITTIVHVLDPGMVAIGGAMTFGGDQSPIGRRFLATLIEEFRQRTFENVFNGTSIRFAELGADAGYLGAAGYARHRLASPTA